MAFTMPFLTTRGIARVHYNIDWAVGYGAPCHLVDTMLVQALMHIFYYEHGGRFPIEDGADQIQMDPPAGHSSIVLDGLFGPATLAHIDSFQCDLRAKYGADIIADHRIDPMRETAATLSTIQRKNYTIAHLNVACNNNDVDMGTRYFFDLRWREDMPIYLRNALKTEKNLAAQYSVGGGQSSPAMKSSGGGSAAFKQV